MSTASPLRHVVVASDFGPASDEALLRGRQLAWHLQARCSVLHVVEPPPVVSAWGDPGAVAWIGLEALVEAGHAALQRQIARLPALAGLEVGQACRVGSPRRDLGALAAELGGDLLVVGCRQQRRLGDRLLGSTAQTAVHHARMPLLVCRRPAAASWSTVLAAVDFSEAAQQAMQLAGRLAPGAAKRLLHVHAPLPEATLALMQPDPGQLEAFAAEAEKTAALRFDAASKAFPEWIAEFRRGAVAEVLLGEIRDRGIDLVAMGTQGRGPWLGGLLGSVSQAVIANAEADVLLVPSPD